jgi:hypothetical protein
MLLGEVYLWEADRAQGRDTRRKYHIFIGDDVDGNKVFLFINTADWYKDYKIAHANYGFLTYDSYVGCSSAVSYTATEIETAAPNLVGELSKADLKGVRDAIIAAETMERRDASFVCRILAAAL